MRYNNDTILKKNTKVYEKIIDLQKITDGMREIQQEITPIGSNDLFIVLDHENAKFDYPIHCHSEYEINLVLHTSGSRVISDSQEQFDDVDLVLISPFIPHVWKSDLIGNHVVTIQFAGDMLDYPMMAKRQFKDIRELLQRAVPAAGFDISEDNGLIASILGLTSTTGFRSVTAFFELLEEMACTPFTVIGTSNMYPSKSRRIAKVTEYTEKNMHRTIRLEEVCGLVNMSPSAFSHFFRHQTSLSYIEYLNGKRVDKACRMLETTMMSVSEICYECGFNNKSNFNRIFLKMKDMSPSEYRKYINRILV